MESVEGVAGAMREVGSQQQCCSTGRENAHMKGECYSPLNGQQPIFALLGYDDIRNLDGRLLTIIDASFSDREQRRAVKNLVRNALWFDWVPNLDTDDRHIGKPDLP
jgi:hypothetical protein